MVGDDFLQDKLTVMARAGRILDIGGGLRILRDRGNRFDPVRAAWIQPILQGVDYQIADPVDTYHPHVVADIHDLPFPDGGLAEIVCLSVLEHVEDPFRAVRELHRVLEPGGHCLVYLPFLFPYHADPGYYKDYWRFTRDGARALFAPFSAVDLRPVHDLFGTMVIVSPLARFALARRISMAIDRRLARPRETRTTGYYLFVTK